MKTVLPARNNMPGRYTEQVFADWPGGSAITEAAFGDSRPTERDTLGRFTWSDGGATE